MRPPEDMYMTEFNVIKAACLRRNACNKVVGRTAEAKAKVYYTCPYCTKKPANFQESLPLLQTARPLVKKCRSKTDNWARLARVETLTLTTLTNTTTNLGEYSSEQAAACLLKFTS